MRRPDIIPAGWVDHHRPVAAATMTLASCEVRGPDVRVEDPVTHLITWQPGQLIVASNCRVQRLGPQRIATLAQQQAIYADYLIAIPYSDDDINVGHMVRITASKDAALIGRKFKVGHVMVGSLVWERDLFCTDDMATG